MPFIKRIYFLLILLSVFNCKKAVENTSELVEYSEYPETEQLKAKQPLSQEFKDYWYAGEAEITSFKLEQARYGELREGTAVLVYVTEDFLPKEQVKADTYSKSNIPILKLNATKNFNTGIYPYSIMQSIFYPVNNNQHAIKISTSVQEWCGHAYTQLNNRDTFEINSHSYFQGEADQNFKLNKSITENELWTQLRIDPTSLPIGTLDILPSLEYIRLRHKTLKAYKAIATLEDGIYTLSYPDLDRVLKIEFNTEFPYDIQTWEETMPSGFGASTTYLTTKATRMESLKSAYWGKNKNKDSILRKTLRLD